MGDGIVQYLEFSGLGDAGPDFVLFHEFGHHVQIANGVFDDLENIPEHTRYTELMADALAAYYAHHPRGATFQTKRIVECARAAFSVGDCSFGSPGHHGTPNQREKAVHFAVDLIDGNSKKGHILTSAEFIGLFDSVYDIIVAPDAN